MTDSPSGVLSFLFTDIEASSLLFAQPADRDRAFSALLRHLEIPNHAVERVLLQRYGSASLRGARRTYRCRARVATQRS